MLIELRIFLLSLLLFFHTFVTAQLFAFLNYLNQFLIFVELLDLFVLELILLQKLMNILPQSTVKPKK